MTNQEFYLLGKGYAASMVTKHYQQAFLTWYLAKCIDACLKSIQILNLGFTCILLDFFAVVNLSLQTCLHMYGKADDLRARQTACAE